MLVEMTNNQLADLVVPVVAEKVEIVMLIIQPLMAHQELMQLVLAVVLVEQTIPAHSHHILVAQVVPVS